jgi:indolepyruvate ferredoxin oxidoreductase
LAGLNAAGFISGYRGSPLGGYDNALWQAQPLLERHDIRFQPGLNEDLAATAVWGSQQVGLFPGAKVDGVFGIEEGDVMRSVHRAMTDSLSSIRNSMTDPPAPC